jgi:hypothetical protein
MPGNRHQLSAVRRGCVKTSARFHTSLFRSLLRGLIAFRVEKIAKNLALLDRLQNVAEFLHGLIRRRFDGPRKLARAAFRRLSRCRRGLTRVVLASLVSRARHVGNPEACSNPGRRYRRLGSVAGFRARCGTGRICPTQAEGGAAVGWRKQFKGRQFADEVLLQTLLLADFPYD